MSPYAFCSRMVLAIAVAIAVTGCSGSPIYPGAKPETTTVAAGQAYETGDSFETVYAWYKRTLPRGSELSHQTFPAKAAVFFAGRGNRGSRVTITPSPTCCRTLIVVADANT